MKGKKDTKLGQCEDTTSLSGLWLFGVWWNFAGK